MSSTRSRRLVQAGLNLWARLTLCGCRDKPYLDHRHRRLHLTTYRVAGGDR